MSLLAFLVSCALIEEPPAGETDTGAPDDTGADTGCATPTTWYADSDADGFGSTSVDACEAPDGFVATGGDCDDGDAAVNPGATETCDTVDNDCDGLTDGDDDGVTGQSSWYADADADDYGAGDAVLSCDAPEGHVDNADDCDDADGNYHPGAAESDCADPNDYNCDGSAGADDNDGDTFAACEECDDGDASVRPDAPEVCDNIDNDCDGETDEAGATGGSTFYADKDGDTFGDPADTTTACDAPAGYVADDTDCDDTDVAVNPDAAETPGDEADGDCDGGELCWADADKDGYGDADGATVASADPSCAGSGEAADGDPLTDCDDSDDEVNPGAVEACDDTVDRNCDGAVGESDSDGDGYAACEECDDGDADINPNATEVCDGVDNDCDAETDEAGAEGGSTWYTDDDGDGYGDPATSVEACDAPSDAVSNGDDCDDTRYKSSPAATEYCNDIDDDCSGVVDDAAADADTWYADDDGDGYGDADDATNSCEQPADSVEDASDCDDSDSGDHPGASETVGNGDDEDCDGGESCYADGDGDGYATASTVVSSDTDCDDSGEAKAAGSDCDDSSASIHPGAAETTGDEIDGDCDGGESCYKDADGDKYGAKSGTTVSSADTDCVDSGESTVKTDCLDVGTYGVYTFPGAAEDEGSDCMTDYDEDGWGEESPVSGVTGGSDCDDEEATTNLAAGETPGDEVDSDCNGKETCYVDGDGHASDDGSTVTSSDEDCGDPGEADDSSVDDCDDSEGGVYPGATETCDGEDEDCDGTVDDGLETTFYLDSDGDGYGVSSSTTEDCALPAGYAEAGGDCDDGDEDANPGETEVCADSIDNDCNGTIDSEAEVAQDGLDQDCDGWDLIVSDDFEADGAALGAGASLSLGGWTAVSGSGSYSTTARSGGYGATFSGESYLCRALTYSYSQVYLSGDLYQPSSGSGELAMMVRNGSNAVGAGIYGNDGFCLFDNSGCDVQIKTGLSGGWFSSTLSMTSSGSASGVWNSSASGSGSSAAWSSSSTTYVCFGGSYSVTMYADNIVIVGK